jgi:hypothetical protein
VARASLGPGGNSRSQEDLSAWEEERRKSVLSTGWGETLGRRNPRRGSAADPF